MLLYNILHCCEKWERKPAREDLGCHTLLRSQKFVGKQQICRQTAKGGWGKKVTSAPLICTFHFYFRFNLPAKGGGEER